MRLLLTTAATLFAATLASTSVSAQDAKDCNASWTNVDSNGNGTVSKSEANKASDVAFKEIDTDANGEITLSEWTNCLSEGSFAASGADRSARWESSFESVDTDKSGDVSASEAAAASEEMHSGDSASATEEALQAGSRFAAIDANADGKVTKQEWSDRDEASIDARFAALDANNDGQVTNSEFKSFREEGYSKAEEAQNQRDQGGEPTIWYYYVYTL